MDDKIILTNKKLKPLLNLGEKYDLRIGVDPDVVTAGFLFDLWEAPDNSANINKLTDLLRNKQTDLLDKNKAINKANREDLIQFLREKLWLNSQTTLETLQKKGFIGKDAKDLKEIEKKAIIYRPLNKYLIKEVTTQVELGRVLFNCLEKTMGDEKLGSLRKKLDKLNAHQEIEEKIVDILLPPIENLENRQKKLPFEKINKNSKKKLNRDLFNQFYKDLDAVLSVNIDLIPKPKLLISLTKLVNLYALLYYLDIICNYKNTDRALIIPICGDTLNKRHQDMSFNCLNVYRQKAISFWKDHITTNIEHNIKVLKLKNPSLEKIKSTFFDNVENAKAITALKRKPAVLKTITDTIGEAIIENSKIYKGSDYSPTELFVLGYLKYNLKSRRTLAKINILDKQGPGAGIIAPAGNKWKHFHLNEELLEVLVICFLKKTKSKTLKNFIDFIEKRYGIVINDNKEIRQKLSKQDLPIPHYDLYEQLIDMLKKINMIVTLSDSTQKLKCSYLT